MIPCYILAIEDESDRTFMTSLFNQYHRLMYKEICQIVKNEWAAQDLLQSTLEALIEKVDELRQKDQVHLVNYIITACRNKSYNYLRDQGRHPAFSVEQDPDYSEPEDGQQPIEVQLVRKVELETLAHIWPQLDERTRYLLEGRYILKKGPEEMAADLGIKPASLRMALTRARKKAYEALLEKLEN